MTPDGRLWAAIVSGMPEDKWMRFGKICEAVAARLTFDDEDLLAYTPRSVAPVWRLRVREMLLAPPAGSRIEWDRRGNYRRR